MNSIKALYSVHTEASDTQGLILNLSDKIIFKKNEKYVVLLNISIHYGRKNIQKTDSKTINSN